MLKQFQFAVAQCGHPSNRTKVECGACFSKRYRKTENGKAVQRKVKRRYLELHRDRVNAGKRRRQKYPHNKAHYNAYRKEYRKNTGHTVNAEIKALRRAIKRLEQSLAKAEQRQKISGASE